MGERTPVARVLVHADGTREHAAADVGDATGLERALEGAVLPALAVEDGKRHVDGQRLYAPVMDNKEAAGLLAHAGDERDLLDVMGVPSAGHVGGIARVVEPLAFLRDADERELEAAGERADDVVSGLAGDATLTMGRPFCVVSQFRFMIRHGCAPAVFGPRRTAWAPVFVGARPSIQAFCLSG